MKAKRPLRLALVGIGKIARDQHIPAIAQSPDFELVSVASRNARVADLPAFPTVESLLAEGPAVDAVSICTPPVGRHHIAAAALAAGKHVMIEKPPGATVAEAEALRVRAERAGVTLFAAWHSREAAGVEAARAWLATRTVRAAHIVWREDIHVWHPGQDWILARGGFGVFDPGINALSIATAILPGHLAVVSGSMTVPEGRASPVRASLTMEIVDNNAPVTAQFDFLPGRPQCWEIVVECTDGELRLADGGARLFIDGTEASLAEANEYSGLYRRFAECIAAGISDVDLRPLQLVADAYLVSDIDHAPISGL